GAAQAQAGRFDEQERGRFARGPRERVAEHQHAAMVGTQVAGKHLARWNAELAREQFVLVAVLDVDLQVREPVPALDELARDVAQHGGLAAGRRAGADDGFHGWCGAVAASISWRICSKASPSGNGPASIDWRSGSSSSASVSRSPSRRRFRMPTMIASS